MKKKILGVIAGAVMLASMAVAPVSATSTVTCPATSKRANQTVKSLAECNLVEDNSLWPTVTNIINVIIGVLGFVTIVVIVLGGVQYTTSAGDAGKVKKAKDTIMYGVIGLVVAILAFAIVNFALGAMFSGSGGEGEGNNSGGGNSSNSSGSGSGSTGGTGGAGGGN